MRPVSMPHSSQSALRCKTPALAGHGLQEVECCLPSLALGQSAQSCACKRLAARVLRENMHQITSNAMVMSKSCHVLSKTCPNAFGAAVGNEVGLHFGIWHLCKDRPAVAMDYAAHTS